MARTRMIKPGFFRSRSLARCSRDARLTFQGLWAEADSAGRGIADPRILKGAIWPLDDDITPDVVSEHLRELEREHIQVYEVDGESYYVVLRWEEHQSASYRTGNPEYPEPPEPNPEDPEACTGSRATCTETPALREVKGREVKAHVHAPSADASEIEDSFEAFWSEYPKRDGKRIGRKQALTVWKRLSKAKRDAAMVGVRHYADSGRMPKDAHRWLRDESWVDWQTPAVPDNPRAHMEAIR